MTRLEFNNQVLQLGRVLYNTAYRYLKRQDEAEDAVQEIFIRLWNRREDLDKYQSLEALAVVSVRNHCIDIIRKRRQISSQGYEKLMPAVNQEPSPAEILENKETRNILDSIIAGLPAAFREIVTMKDIDGLSYDEIAELTGQNINSLRVSLSRARKMIRDEFRKYRYEYTGSNKASR